MREKIEWLNYWIEDANENKKRILLIGDSVSRDIRKGMCTRLKDEYAVDLLAMSYSIFEDDIENEIEHYFIKNPYQYEYILYNLGAHQGYSRNCIDSEKNQQTFIEKSN